MTKERKMESRTTPETIGGQMTATQRGRGQSNDFRYAAGGFALSKNVGAKE
jgi:hypothetical protein